jgi:hypothetical protein
MQLSFRQNGHAHTRRRPRRPPPARSGAPTRWDGAPPPAAAPL